MSDVLRTDAPPQVPARQIAGHKPDLLLRETHHLCPGCGEPLALRMMLEAIEALGAQQRTIGVLGIGCYTSFGPVRPRAKSSNRSALLILVWGWFWCFRSQGVPVVYP